MTQYPHLATLLDAWRDDVRLMTERYAQLSLAAQTTKHIEELEAAISRENDEPLSLRQAAAASGFSEDHVGRLVRDNKIENVGKRNRPLIRRSDLPRKAGALQESSTTLSIVRTRKQIARAVIDRTEGAT